MNPITAIQVLTLDSFVEGNQRALEESTVVFLEILLEKAPAFSLQILLNFSLDTWGYWKFFKLTLSFVSLLKGIFKFISLRKATVMNEERKKALAKTRFWCLAKNGWHV